MDMMFFLLSPSSAPFEGSKKCDFPLIQHLEVLLSFFIILQEELPSRELTYPTLGKGKSSSKLPW